MDDQLKASTGDSVRSCLKIEELGPVRWLNGENTYHPSLVTQIQFLEPVPR